MKIVVETPERMVVEDRPWGLGGFLILFILSSLYGAWDSFIDGDAIVTALLLGIAALIFWALNRYVALGRLELNKAENSAYWHQISASKRVRRGWALSDLRRVIIEVHRGKGETHRITMIFDNGDDPMPLTPYFSGLGRQEETKKRINRFLGAPESD